MDTKEINQLLLNQRFHKANLSLKWLAEDMRNLNEAVSRAAQCFKDFSITACKKIPRRINK